jgi:hypothetical protein
MKPANCPQEAALTKAIRTGRLDESLTSHADGCATCREIIQTASWMQALAHSSESSPNLPHASLVWWKAQLSEEQVKTEQAQDFYELVEMGSAAVISVGLLGWLTWNWFAIQGSVASILEGAELWLTAYPVANVLLPAVGVLCVIAFVLAYPILIDE